MMPAAKRLPESLRSPLWHTVMVGRERAREAVSWSRVAALALSVAFCADGMAQSTVTPGITSLTYTLTDRNGVSLTSLRPSAQINDVSIGSNERPLDHRMVTDDGETSTPTIRFSDSYVGKVQGAAAHDRSPLCAGQAYLDASLGASADRMCGAAGGPYSALRGTGSSMVTNPDGTKTYTDRDGNTRLYGIAQGPSSWLLTRMTDRFGVITTLTYKSAAVSSVTIYRLQSVNRNDGLQLKYTYGSNVAPTNLGDGPWRQIASVRAINNAVDYCDPQADTCTFTQAWPTATYSRTTSGSPNYFTVIDAAGRATRFTTGIPTLSGGVYGTAGPANYTTQQLLAIRAPTSSSADTTSFTYCAVTGEYYCVNQGVKKVTTDGYDWLYPATSAGGGVSLFVTVTASRPVGGSQITTQQRGNPTIGPLISYTDGIGLNTFYFEQSSTNRLSHVTQGDGDDLSYLYDARGNITRETHTPASGSPLPAAVRTAGFDATCTNPVKCNKPNWVRDAKSNLTEYAYHSINGNPLRVVFPADPSGIKPQLSYHQQTTKYAWYKNSSGAVVRAATPIWVITGEKYCRKTAAAANGTCGVAGDEVTIAYDYGPSGLANNLFLRGKSVTADGVTLRTCYGYDIYGNRISETSPKAGLASCP